MSPAAQPAPRLRVQPGPDLRPARPPERRRPAIATPNGPSRSPGRRVGAKAADVLKATKAAATGVRPGPTRANGPAPRRPAPRPSSGPAPALALAPGLAPRPSPAPGPRPGRSRAVAPVADRGADPTAPPRSARRWSGIFGLSRHGKILAVVVAVVSVFALAGIQAQLVSGQQHLDGLEAELADRQARNVQLRAEVETLSSPDRIVETAIALGMVRPDHVTYLVAPADTARAVAAVDRAPTE